MNIIKRWWREWKEINAMANFYTNHPEEAAQSALDLMEKEGKNTRCALIYKHLRTVKNNDPIERRLKAVDKMLTEINERDEQ